MTPPTPTQRVNEICYQARVCRERLSKLRAEIVKLRDDCGWGDSPGIAATLEFIDDADTAIAYASIELSDLTEDK